MKKKLVLILLVLTLLTSGAITYAWWSSNSKETDNTLTMGYGLRLEVEGTTANQDELLIPAGSTFDGVDGYTTQYVFTYTIQLDANLVGIFDLDVQVEEILIGGVAYNGFIENHGLLMFDISVNNAGIAPNPNFSRSNLTTPVLYNDATPNFAGTSFADVEEVISSDHRTVVVTITIYLANNNFVPAPEFPLLPENFDLSAAYTALAGKVITFKVSFELKLNA